MSSKLKANQVRVRLEDADAPIVDKLAGKSLSRANVTSVLLAAAIDAVREAGGHVGYWPPKFQITYQGREGRPDASRFNEAAPATTKRK
jgi:hypothetical protein